MNAVWTRLHSLVTSLMLVAMLSFVGHGIAMASLQQHGAGGGGHDAASTEVHMHGSVPHYHGAGATETAAAHDFGLHVQPADLTADVPSSLADTAGMDHHATGGAKAACCGQACVSAIQVSAPQVVAAPLKRKERMEMRSQTGSGIDPSGLKRPPRTPDIG